MIAPPSAAIATERPGPSARSRMCCATRRNGCWIGSTIFAADLVRTELGLPADWEPLGAIAIGYPEQSETEPREPVAVSDLLVRK